MRHGAGAVPCPIGSATATMIPALLPPGTVMQISTLRECSVLPCHMSCYMPHAAAGCRYGVRGFWARDAKPVVLTRDKIDGIHLTGMGGCVLPAVCVTGRQAIGRQQARNR